MPRVLRAIPLTLLLAAAATAHAGTYVLAGGPSPTDALGNDDNITVYVNNIQVGVDDCCNGPPIKFAANPGDVLHVTVVDTAPVCYGVNPLYLFSNGNYAVLDPVGVPTTCGESVPSGTFYDKTFTVPAITSAAVPTLTAWGKIILSGLLAIGAIFALRRQRQ